jgi:hypothetical protein
MTDERKTILLAVADYAHSLANDGECAPDYRWMDQYVDTAAKRYKVALTTKERQQIEREVRSMP